MVDLNRDEIAFLGDHGLTENDVFDWRGYKSSERRKAIKAAGKTLALGTPCLKGGHRLRTRAGHCAQCDPAKIAYQSRKTMRAVLYAARSEAIQCFKVGISEDPDRRIGDLNRETYGGATDWQIFMARELNDAGKSEVGIHRDLSGFAKAAWYRKGNHRQEAQELFACSAEQVVKAFQSNICEQQLVARGYAKAPVGF